MTHVCSTNATMDRSGRIRFGRRRQLCSAATCLALLLGLSSLACRTGGQGLPADDSAVVGAISITSQLRAVYSRSKAWQASYTVSPSRACSADAGSLCAAKEDSDELTAAELSVATTPSHYDGRLQRFTGNFQAVSPALDQGSCYTCASFAVLGAAESAIASVMQVNASTVRLSQQQLAYCLPSLSGLQRNCRSAWSLKEAVNTLVTSFKGPRQVTTATCMPYSNAIQTDKPNCTMLCGPLGDDPTGLLIGTFTGKLLMTAWEIQRHITLYGAAVSRLTVYSDFRPFFEANRTGVYTGPSANATLTYNHAIILVGFDNENEFWIARNSWGPDFADRGFFRIAFGVSGVGSFGDTYGIIWEPASPAPQQSELFPIPGRVGCYSYTGKPWDFVSRVASRFGVPIASVLLQNTKVIEDPRQFLGGLPLQLCGVDAGLVPPATEQQALMQLKAQIDPDGSLTSWQVPARDAAAGGVPAHCSWRGVSCNGQGKVVGISLLGSLGGVLPSSITLTGLPQLQMLSLQQAELTGTMPSGYRSLKNLQQLVLTGCALSGSLPDGWGSGLPALQGLAIVNSRLQGAMPPGWASMPSLTFVNLTNNFLRGPLPASWSAWGPQLTTLDVSRNKLNGSLPSEWRNWTAVERLLLFGNRLGGTLPKSWAALGRLQELQLQGNQLSGTLPGEWGSGLASLQTLSLADNALRGTLPPAWGNWSSITNLDVSRNQLGGPLPASYSRWTRMLGAMFVGNQFTGTLPPSWGAWKSIFGFDVSQNKLSGPLPATYGAWRSLYAGGFGGNAFSGTLPPAWGSMSSTFALVLSNNNLTGSLPASWVGMSRMNVLVASTNRLSGQLPPAWATLRSLFLLLLGSNTITGSLPLEWSGLSGLLVLDLSSNKLSGTLPGDWSTMPGLQVLSLANNRLGGALPAGWGASTTFQGLDLSWNALGGSLPTSWGSLRQAYSINLAGNRLKGGVPASWSRLGALTSVSLNDNPDLSGCLPGQWRSFPSLAVVYTPPKQRSALAKRFDVFGLPNADDVGGGAAGTASNSENPFAGLQVTMGGVRLGLKGGLMGSLNTSTPMPQALAGTGLHGFCSAEAAAAAGRPAGRPAGRR